MTTTIGIDPGKDGACVVLRGTEVLSARLTADLVGKLPWASAHPVMAAYLRGVVAEHRPSLAVLELYAGRPGEGRGSSMTTGVGWGLWLGLLSAMGVPAITPASSAWTRAMFRDVQGDGKARSVSVALARVPSLDLSPGRRRVPHAGLADAACLALYGAARGDRP